MLPSLSPSVFSPSPSSPYLPSSPSTVAITTIHLPQQTQHSHHRQYHTPSFSTTPQQPRTPQIKHSSKSETHNLSNLKSFLTLPFILSSCHSITFFRTPFISLQTTLILSLILPFHALLHRLTSSHATSSSSSIDEAEPTSLYEGTVYHQRRRPVHHSFQYNVRYALIDLDRAPHAPPNHLSPDEARQITGTHGPILLLTIPPSVGYEQNPLSVYYCYDVEESATCLKKCIAEVTNTPWAARDDGKTLVTALWVDHSADIGSPYPR